MSHNTLILSVAAFTFGVITRPLRTPEYAWAVFGAVVMIAFGFLPQPRGAGDHRDRHRSTTASQRKRQRGAHGVDVGFTE
jgi:hypothetical protein